MKLFVAAIGMALFSLFNWHCTKIDSTTIGSNLIPAVDNVSTFDTTINVITNNVDSNSIDCTNIYPTDDRPLGYISNDPYFGITNAIMYAEFKPLTFPFAFHPSLSQTIDSVVLILKYKRSYGDSTKPHKLNVFLLQDVATNFDSSSCSFHDFNPPFLKSITYTATNLNDTTPLRISLTASQLGFLTTAGAFNSDSAFKAAFHGFAFQDDITFPGTNSISYFNLADTTTRLAIYSKYVDTAAGHPTVSTIDYFSTSITNILSQSASYISRYRPGSEIVSHSNNLSNPNGDDFVYIQTQPGSYATVKIPALNSVSNRIIHRAELIIDQVYSPAATDKYLATPNYLFLDYKDSGSSYHLELCDFSFSGTTGPNLSQFGGYRTYATDNGGNTISRYTFNISRYVQNIITKGVSSRTFRLYSPSLVTSGTTLLTDPLCNSGLVNYPSFLINAPVVGRVKVYGGSPTNVTNPNRMRVHIIYSKI